VKAFAGTCDGKPCIVLEVMASATLLVAHADGVLELVAPEHVRWGTLTDTGMRLQPSWWPGDDAWLAALDAEDGLP